MSKLRVEYKVRFGKSRRHCNAKRAVVAKPRERVLRIAKLMALAIRFDQLIRDGLVNDQSGLARLGQVSRARLTQIMNLLQLAPDIQEALLFLPTAQRGRDGITEKQIRSVTRLIKWQQQRGTALIRSINR